VQSHGSGARYAGRYAVVVLAMCALYPFLPAFPRALLFALSSASTLLPIALRIRRDQEHGRLPWVLLFIAMTDLTAANVLAAVNLRSLQLVTEFSVTFGHAIVLAAVLAVVIRRGRNDVGGIIDISVALTGAGTLLWTCLLEPHLAEIHAPLNARIALLVSIFVLTGVLGAVARLWATARHRRLALELFIAALVLALLGNIALSTTTGTLATENILWVQEAFMLTYLCVGAAAVHPSSDELSRPGPAPVDRLTAGRLLFLGAAIILNPVIGGGRQLFGRPADGLVIVLGTLAVAPLVMLRIHRLGRQREEAERALRHQATHDPLTGLVNRGELRHRLAVALEREHAYGRLGVVLLFCDLNGFKPVNDRLGHAVGDQVLVEVGRRLGAGLPAGDTLARYGGDEFLLLCSSSGPADALDRLARHVRAALDTPFRLAGEEITIGASVGAVMSDGRADADELIHRADEAMYAVKHARAITVG
jgi:diguanylate cyclase (GGDEF)-like protein